jgi:hypothetical protein
LDLNPRRDLVATVRHAVQSTNARAIIFKKGLFVGFITNRLPSRRNKKDAIFQCCVTTGSDTYADENPSLKEAESGKVEELYVVEPLSMTAHNPLRNLRIDFVEKSDFVVTVQTADSSCCRQYFFSG